MADSNSGKTEAGKTGAGTTEAGTTEAGTTEAGTTEAGTIIPNDEQSKAFVKGIVERGEAARVEPGAKLPPGVTHEIVGETESGLPIIKRRRMSLF